MTGRARSSRMSRTPGARDAAISAIQHTLKNILADHGKGGEVP